MGIFGRENVFLKRSLKNLKKILKKFKKVLDNS